LLSLPFLLVLLVSWWLLLWPVLPERTAFVAVRVAHASRPADDLGCRVKTCRVSFHVEPGEKAGARWQRKRCHLQPLEQTAFSPALGRCIAGARHRSAAKHGGACRELSARTSARERWDAAVDEQVQPQGL
jgi:hypothetical protein